MHFCQTLVKSFENHKKALISLRTGTHDQTWCGHGSQLFIVCFMRVTTLTEHTTNAVTVSRNTWAVREPWRPRTFFQDMKRLSSGMDSLSNSTPKNKVFCWTILFGASNLWFTLTLSVSRPCGLWECPYMPLCLMKLSLNTHLWECHDESWFTTVTDFLSCETCEPEIWFYHRTHRVRELHMEVSWAFHDPYAPWVNHSSWLRVFLTLICHKTHKLRLT